LNTAPTHAPVKAAAPGKEYFIFVLGDLTLGVVSSHAREVTRPGLLTPLPRLPAFVLGVVGHRGEVLPVIDLLRFLGQGEMQAAARKRLFIGSSQAFSAAFLADRVLGLRHLTDASVLPPPLGGAIPAEHLLGVVRDGPRTLNLIDLPRLMQVARARIVTR
jgi:purine-binding chemotaxis protein CheW